eukprot:TRINITY_DN38999_c0_g1_i1.p2 TRINITY_DN38999_c0_g1~~TRINITY_DN38999_c0_g1_i1.p2  ORF type:complete len:458 (-),score=2.97 TRINITY_DN38999_c0_g1_i1:823-2172(-)
MRAGGGGGGHQWAVASAASSLAPVSASARQRVTEQLVALAEAYATDDEPNARMLHRKLSRRADRQGDPLQRTAHYFLHALHARQTGTGTEVFRSPLEASAEDVSRAMMLLCRAVPFVHTCRAIVHEAIMDAIASEGGACSHLHLVSFGMWPGHDWLGVLRSLAQLPNGPPPRVTLTAIDAPTTPGKLAVKFPIELFGVKLEQAARHLGINFTFRLSGCSMENLRPGVVHRSGEPGETVIATCAMHMQFLPDVTVVRSNPRDTVLRAVHELRPSAFILVDMDVNFNAPFFLSRFREAVTFFTNIFACVDASGLARDLPERALFESCYFSRDMVNVVACEGLDRMIRPERVEQWEARLQRLGFFARPLPPTTVQSVSEAVKAGAGAGGGGGGAAGVGAGGSSCPGMKSSHVGFDVVNRGSGLQVRYNNERLLWAGVWHASPPSAVAAYQGV